MPPAGKWSSNCLRLWKEELLALKSHLLLLSLLLIPCLAPAQEGPDFSMMRPSYDVDVCVVGGGPAGCAAAVAAARNGAETLLVEQYGFLGGTATASSVSVFMTYRYAGGLFRELLQRLDAHKARRGGSFNVAGMQVVLDEMVTEAGVRVLLYTRGIACLTAKGRPWQGQPRRNITGLVIHNKSGLQLVRAKAFIDCTGDADLAAWAGVPFEVGREADGMTQPMTMIFRMGNVKFSGGSIMSYPGMEDYWCSYAWDPNPNEMTLNMTRIKGFSGLNAEDLSQATILGRQAVMEAVEALKRNVPGFEEAYLVALPAQIGVRETRRIAGATTLTGEQIVNPGWTYLHRADAIARNNYDVDIHDPQGTKATIVKLQQPYEIPYRSLLPRGIDNLLVAGRPISADHVAHSSLRIQPTCWGLGQAAGTAAAFASALEVGPWEIGQGNDPAFGQPFLKELQRTLIRQGADLGEYRAELLGVLPEYDRWQLKYRLEAYAVSRDFDDVPRGHPAYDAVIGLGKMGVFHGVSETRFGGDQVATVAMAAVVISRAFALMPAKEPLPRPAELPQRLSGQWWSSGLAFCVAKGIIPVGELESLNPDAPLTSEQLQGYLAAAFPEHEEFSPLSPELLRDNRVSRAGLAVWLWECIVDRLDL